MITLKRNGFLAQLYLFCRQHKPLPRDLCSLFWGGVHGALMAAMIVVFCVLSLYVTAVVPLLYLLISLQAGYFVPLEDLMVVGIGFDCFLAAMFLLFMTLKIFTEYEPAENLLCNVEEAVKSWKDRYCAMVAFK